MLNIVQKNVPDEEEKIFSKIIQYTYIVYYLTINHFILHIIVWTLMDR